MGNYRVLGFNTHIPVTFRSLSSVIRFIDIYIYGLFIFVLFYIRGCYGIHLVFSLLQDSFSPVIYLLFVLVHFVELLAESESNHVLLVIFVTSYFGNDSPYLGNVLFN